MYGYLIKRSEIYGSGKEEICQSNFKCKTSDVNKKVIIASTWEVDIFSKHANNIKPIAGNKNTTT